MPFRVGTNRIGRLVVGDSFAYDTDAQAFFTAVEGGGDTLTTTEKDATNQFVLDLKSAGVWTAMDLIYPFVGGTSTSTKWNLKDPQDTDAAFRITWQNPGNGTFSADGVKGDGGSFAGNTHLVPSTAFNSNPRHLSAYANLADAGNSYDMGSNAPGVGNNNVLIVEYGNNTSYAGFGGFITAANASGVGQVIGTYDGGASPKVNVYLNGSSANTGNTTVTDYSVPMAIFGDNRAGTPGGFSPTEYTERRLATITMGDILDSTEASDLYDATQTFNTSLSRQV